MEIHSEWAGQCKPIQAIFRRVQLESGDEKIKFAHVCAFLHRFLICIPPNLSLLSG